MHSTFLLRKRAITIFLSRKFMITRSSIAFEDFLGSLITPKVMPPWYTHKFIYSIHPIANHPAKHVAGNNQKHNVIGMVQLQLIHRAFTSFDLI